MKRLAALLILSSALLSACASSQWSQTTVAKEYDFIVAMEQQGPGEAVQQKYQHPCKIGRAELEKLMGDLTYSEKVGLPKTETQSPVFQPTEITRMAPALVEALAKADPSQRIRFASFNLGKAALFSVSQKTEGVLFMAADGRLNIAFNFINSQRNPSETSAVYHRYAKVDPLNIRTSETTLATVAPYAERHKFETGKQAPMWVMADLKKLQEATSAAAIPVVEVTEEAAPRVAPGAVALDTPVNKAASRQASEEQRKADIKNKLKFLKELLDEKLISVEDYNAKKLEVLDRLD